MVKLKALTDLHKARIRQWKGKLDQFKGPKDQFDPVAFSKRVFRISKAVRILTVITMILLLTNAVIVSIREWKVDQRNKTLPLWVIWSTGIYCSIISLCLLYTLVVLLKTFNLYVKGRLRRETLWIRKYFTLFSLSFTFMTILIIWSFINELDLPSNFFKWPLEIKIP